MRISRKAEYALRALTAIGRRPLHAVSQVEEVSTEGGIPLKFLEQILLILRRGGLLKSRRGVGGGYQLVRPPDRITLADVLYITDGPIQPMSCTPPEPGHAPAPACSCSVPGCCGAGQVFTDLQNQIHGFLSSVTIADLVARESGAPSMQFDI